MEHSPGARCLRGSYSFQHREPRDLRQRAFAEQALQSIEPVILAGGLEKDGIDVHLAGGQSLQPFYIDSL